MESKLIMISELPQTLPFVVKQYQRGYKWTERQLTELLDDIYLFDKDKEEVYCLQPIIVHNDGQALELIDGQQRLTTIYMILKYLDPESSTFNIQYKTREHSETFLRNERVYDRKKTEWEDYIEKHPNYNNVDVYHFFQAQILIREWFDHHAKDKESQEKFKEKLLNHTGVIWYEPRPSGVDNSPGIEPYQIFRNINAGKICLTDSELIKSVLLIQDRKDCDDSPTLFDRTALSREWDFIEQSLQDHVLWGFLNPEAKHGKEYVNRIEYLFDLCLKHRTEKQSAYELFHAFEKEKDKNGVWNNVKNTFMIFQEWFNDDDLYHWIGYLRATKAFDMNNLLELWRGKGKTKKIFKKDIKKEIQKSLPQPEEINNLNYEAGDDKRKITNLLLFFNIMTLRSKETQEPEAIEWHSRFRFDLYLKESWSLEHIHAQNEVPRSDFGLLAKWLSGSYNYFHKNSKLDSALKKEAVERVFKEDSGNDDGNFQFMKDVFKACSDIDNEKYQTITDWKSKPSLPSGITIDVLVKLAECLKDETIHTIGNLALLSGDLNSGLSNLYFDEKRDRLISYDKKGRYILPATKNVFLKYYSDSTNESNFAIYGWSEQDQDNYKKDIENTLEAFGKEIES